jgi:fumarate hydratase class I
MEAVWKIEVVDFPAFILVDAQGNDFFASGCGACLPGGVTAAAEKAKA